MSPTTLATAGSRRIRAGSLSPAAFAAYGEVIQNPATHAGAPQALESVEANQGSATKWLDVTHMSDFYELSASRRQGRAVVNMFVCRPRELREWEGREVFDIKILERHPFTAQTFIPMGLSAEDDTARYLVIVAPTLPLTSGRDADYRQPPYPAPERPQRKRGLRERLLGARPNPFTNDHFSSTTPPSSPSGEAAGVARKGPGLPDLDNIQAFIARGDQAVTYGPGTWHAPMVVLGDKAIDFVVVQYANGVAMEDCQEVEIVLTDGGGGLAVDVNAVDVGVKAKL